MEYLRAADTVFCGRKDIIVNEYDFAGLIAVVADLVDLYVGNFKIFARIVDSNGHGNMIVRGIISVVILVTCHFLDGVVVVAYLSVGDLGELECISYVRYGFFCNGGVAKLEI